MADNDAQALAQAAARIAALQADLDRSKTETANLTRQLAQANTHGAALAAVTVERDRLRDQIAEYQAMFADPPAGSGIDKVTRYRTSDGSKHKTLPEARRQAAILGVMTELGVSGPQAAAVVEKRDALRSHFAIVDGPLPT